MATISFKTLPRKVYYNYLKDGHIISITQTKPTQKEIGDGGGVWYCYFEGTSYYKGDDDKFYPLYIENGSSRTPVNTNSFHNKNNTYVYKNGSNYIRVNVSPNTNYYVSQNESGKRTWPNDASELPFIDDTVDEVTTRYYLDTLILNGGSYYVVKGSKKQNFYPLDNDGEEKEKTFGDCLIELIKSNVSIDSFDTDVSSLPTYLVGEDYGNCHIVSLDYSVGTNYFYMYGELFLEKLKEKIEKDTNSLIDRYANTSIPKEASCVLEINDIQRKSKASEEEIDGFTMTGTVTSID